MKTPATISVFDPPMCCSTGVCGPGVDPALARFAGDLDAMKAGGAVVERFNLAQDLAAFAANPLVKKALSQEGKKCLPLVFVGGREVSRGRYPTREEIADWIAGDGTVR